MTSRVIDSQLKNDRFIGSSAAQFDPLYPGSHESVVSPVAPDRVSIDITQKATPGSQWTHRLSQNGYVGDMYLRVQLPAPAAGNYCAYPGLAIIDRVLIRNATETLMEYDYATVMQYILNKLDDETRLKVFELAGGAALGAAQEVICPIPAFWSALGSEKGESMHPVAAHLLNSPIEVQCTFRPLASLGAVGWTPPAGFTAVTFTTMEFATSDALRFQHQGSASSFMYKGIDFQTNTANVVPSATATRIDVSSFNGSIRDMLVANNLVTDITTAHDFYACQPIDTWHLSIDGQRYLEAFSRQQIEYEQLVSGHSTRNSTAGLNEPDFLPLGYRLDMSQRDYVGALSVDDVNDLRLEVQHSSGADTQVSVLARVDAKYVIERGHLHKQLR